MDGIEVPLMKNALGLEVVRTLLNATMVHFSLIIGKFVEIHTVWLVDREISHPERVAGLKFII